jgi:ABC-type Fe3+/spermidine/putrescine transport system ATPase subunit
MVLADRIAVLRDGGLQQLGPPEELYQRPETSWVADFIGLTNFIRGTVAGRATDRLTVQTALGTFETVGSPAAGQVVVCIRPEALRFDGGLPNRLRGVVRERAFLGNLLDYRVECEDRTLLRVQADPSRRYKPGDPVELAFATSDAWTVAAGT